MKTLKIKLLHVSLYLKNFNGIEGKMFGAKCIKSTNKKVVAFFWKENMVFKLDEQSQKEALKLKLHTFMHLKTTKILGINTQKAF